MSNQEAITRLQDHFRLHNDGRQTPLLDKAVSKALYALILQIKIIDILRTHKNSNRECIEQISKLVDI